MSNDDEGAIALLDALATVPVPPADLQAVLRRGARRRRVSRLARGTALASVVVLTGWGIVGIVGADGPVDEAEVEVGGTSPASGPAGDPSQRGSAGEGTDSATIEIPPVPADLRLTMPAEDLPELPSPGEVDRILSTTPEEERDFWYYRGGQGEVRTAWTVAIDGGSVRLMFDHQRGEFAGVYISNMSGPVSREAYETPGFDPEVALREALGEAEFEALRERRWRAIVTYSAEDGVDPEDILHPGNPDGASYGSGDEP